MLLTVLVWMHLCLSPPTTSNHYTEYSLYYSLASLYGSGTESWLYIEIALGALKIMMMLGIHPQSF